MAASSSSHRRQMVEHLRDRLEAARRAQCGKAEEVVSSGHEPLDGLLPGHGFRRGTLVEWLTPGLGSGAGSLALAAAREACRQGGPLVVVDRAGQFYPPSARAAGLDLRQLILLRPRHVHDELWALNQALRCRGVGAVLCWTGPLHQRALRRCQLAVEQAATLGLLVRPLQAAAEPCWAEVRLAVEPLPTVEAAAPSTNITRRVRVELLRSRTGGSGASIELELHHETSALRMAPTMAPAATGHRRRGAS